MDRCPISPWRATSDCDWRYRLSTAVADEWTIFDDRSSPDWSPEVFVNIGTFTVVPVEEMRRRRDPTWERDALGWLIPPQERFWNSWRDVRPVSYVAMGDNDIVVTRSQAFAARLSSP
jgi:hypothetical protein